MASERNDMEAFALALYGVIAVLIVLVVAVVIQLDRIASALEGMR